MYVEHSGILNWLGRLELQLLLKSGLLGFNMYLHPALRYISSFKLNLNFKNQNKIPWMLCFNPDGLIRYVEILDGAGALRVTAKIPRLSGI